MSEIINMEVPPAKLDGGWGKNGRVGLVVLANDQTVEYDLQSILSPCDIGVFGSRIFMDLEVNPTTLDDMRSRIGQTASLILPGVPLDVLAYGCTSASAVIGEKSVFEQLSKREASAKMTTPTTAAIEAFKHLNVKRIGLLTPYVGEVNDLLINYIEKNSQVKVTRLTTFNLSDDRDVASVSIPSIVSGAEAVGKEEDVDCVFVSCTNLRAVEAVVEVERRIGKPVTSSNHAMAWHIIKLLGMEGKLGGRDLGRLFTK